MNFENESTEVLRMQFEALVKSKFHPPYLEEEQRKSIDSIILKIWQELKKRELNV